MMRVAKITKIFAPSTRTAVCIVLSVSLASCASQPDTSSYTQVPGFFSGLWHGLVAPVAFVFAIFTDIRIYAFPNSGNWYDLGFLLGLSAWAGGAASAN
jgi:hypothetical protein